MDEKVTKCHSNSKLKSNSISNALNHLKMTKKEGFKNQLYVEEQEPLYYEVEEHEYNQLIEKKSLSKFIEDDNEEYKNSEYDAVDMISYDTISENTNQKHSSRKRKKRVETDGDMLLKRNEYTLSSSSADSTKRSKFFDVSTCNEDNNDCIMSLSNLLNDSDVGDQLQAKVHQKETSALNVKLDKMNDSVDTEEPEKVLSSGLQVEENFEDWELFKEAERQSKFEAFFTSEKTEFLPQGDLVVYWFDIYDDQYVAPGSVFIFGHLYDQKLHSKNATLKSSSECRSSSIAIRVNNVRRVVHVVPKKNVELDDVRQEIETIGKRLGIAREQIWTKKVRKNYAFQLKNVPQGESDYLEVSYPFDCQEFSNVAGKTFHYIIGTSRTATELFILHHQIWGPCWLLIQNHEKTSSSFSWCNYDCVVEDVDDIKIAKFPGMLSIDARGQACKIEPNTLIEHPLNSKLNVLSINVKTLINQLNRQNEIYSVTLWLSRPIATDSSHCYAEEDELAYKVFLRRLPGMRSVSTKYSFIELCASETALLNGVVSMIKLWDPDVLIGYGFLNLDLELLIHRLQICKIDYWSRLGRLRWSKISKSKSIVGNESKWRCRQVTAGRLLCDLQSMVAEFEMSASLTKCFSFETLVSTYYPEIVRREVKVEELILEVYSDDTQVSSLEQKITNFALATRLDAKLVFRLITQIDALTLTYQLTTLAGNVWSNSLMGARAERIDYLLLHKFSSANYILPDKVKQKNAFKKVDSKYKGGLVLEPKVGFYNSIVLLLDFNSLYPSIIQEYNICFTTVQKTLNSDGDWIEANPTLNTEKRGILSECIAQLVKRRKEIKDQIARESDTVKKKQLDVRQLAVKLVANSMYGCLGFENSRFYALPLAELITRKGRESLTKAQDIVTNKELEIIYGDTDSLMIDTHVFEYNEAYKLGLQLLSDINSAFSKLKIGIDGLFKKLLLLKKKKYAALQYVSDGQLKITRKGLDLVRRDWCKICSQIGNKILEMMFQPTDQDLVENIHEYLKEVSTNIRTGKFSMENFVIYKTLNKNLEAYSEGKNLAHVKVAFDLKQQNKNVFVGKTIDYVICKTTSGESSLASKAFSPDDALKNSLSIDYEWYILNQIFPSVSRLCEFLEGASIDAILNSFEINSKSLKNKVSKENSNVMVLLMSEECWNYDEWVLNCPSCKARNTFFGIEKKINLENLQISSKLKDDIYSCLRCKGCSKQYPSEWLLNNFTCFINTLVRNYYKPSFVCSEMECGSTRSFQLAFKHGLPLCMSSDCSGTMDLLYDQVKLYNQLMYLNEITSIKKLINQLAPNLKTSVESTIKNFLNEYHLLNRINSTAFAFISQNKYSDVNLESVFSVYNPKGDSSMPI